MSRPLTAAMDNVLAWRMGEALSHAFRARKGDYIDGGLALLRELNEKGFDVVERKASGSLEPSSGGAGNA